MKKLAAALFAAAALVSAPALAQDAPSLGITFNIAGTSDYVFRGISQTDEKAAVQGGADLSYGIFYAGIWASNVDFNIPGVNEEIDYYVGIKPTLGPINLDLGILRYSYPGDNSSLDVTEFKIAGSHTFENGPTVGLNYFYSPEFGDGGPSYSYYELAGSMGFGSAGPFALGGLASIGNTDYESNRIYADNSNWKLGVSATTETGWYLELAYTDTDLDNTPTADGRAVLLIKYNFGLPTGN